MVADNYFASIMAKIGQHAGTLIDTAKQNSVIEKSGINGCSRCNKRGIAFLPVRYAVGELDKVDHCALPEERISHFTTIKLNESVNKTGGKTLRDPKSCYILRKLRKGYLYVYDNHPGLASWLCYGVNEHGELTSFPAANPMPLDELTPMENCTEGVGHPARASLVSLRDPHVNRTIHLMFLEVALDVSRLDWIARHPEWRTKHMQSFASTSPKNSPDYFSRTEIPKFVPEYNDYRWPFDALQHQMWQGRYTSVIAGEKARLLKMDTCEILWHHMDTIQCASGSAEGFMFAVKDEVGIVEQLDAQRAYPTAVLRKDMLPGDTKIPGTPDNLTLNERNYKWYLAVQQFQAIMQSMKIRDEEVDDNYIAPGMRQTYKEVLNELEEKEKQKALVIQRHINTYSGYKYLSPDEQNDVINKRLKYYDDYILFKKKAYEREWVTSRKAEMLTRNSAIKEIDDYYNGEDWKKIDSVVGKYVVNIKELTPLFDSDYSLWVINHLHYALDRYDETSFMHCGHVSSIIADVLQHGILSAASNWMWSLLQDFKDEGRILLRGFTFNMPTVFSEINEYLAPGKDKTDIEKLQAIIKSSKKCYEKFKKAYDKAKKDSLKKAIWDKGDLQVYAEAIKKINAVHLNVTTSSWINDASDALAKEKGVANRYISDLKGEKKIYALNETARTITQVLAGSDPADIQVAKYTFTLGELNDLSEGIHAKLGSVRKHLLVR